MVSESVLLFSTLSFVVQLVVLGLLIFGYFLKRMRKFRQHGMTMTVAVFLHLVTVFSWMIRSFASYFGSVSFNFGDLLILVTLAHVAFGVFAASFGVWLVASWHLKKDISKCFTRKRIMLTTITLWLTAIALGFVLYVSIVLS